MILYHTEKSPFARKVRMVLYHHGLLAETQLIFSMPTERKPELMAHNPLGKIPVLVTDDGASIIDSPVICQYLDNVGRGPLLVPATKEERIRVMLLEALADGIMESSVTMMLEAWRPKEFQWPQQFSKQTDNILRTLVELEKQIDFIEMPRSLAHLSAACAIDYLHHRLSAIGVEEEWLANSPKLAAWHQKFSQEPVMVNTLPEGGW